MKIGIVLGTRPEIIKMSPIIDEIKKKWIRICYNTYWSTL